MSGGTDGYDGWTGNRMGFRTKIGGVIQIIERTAFPLSLAHVLIIISLANQCNSTLAISLTMTTTARLISLLSLHNKVSKASQRKSTYLGQASSVSRLICLMGFPAYLVGKGPGRPPSILRSMAIYVSYEKLTLSYVLHVSSMFLSLYPCLRVILFLSLDLSRTFCILLPVCLSIFGQKPCRGR